jgi:hypothetical protein
LRSDVVSRYTVTRQIYRSLEASCPVAGRAETLDVVKHRSVAQLLRDAPTVFIDCEPQLMPRTDDVNDAGRRAACVGCARFMTVQKTGR